MATAAVMFSQDHGDQYPGRDWVKDLKSQGIEYKQLACNSSTADPAKHEISYGYNSLMLAPSGKGIATGHIKTPDKVGLFCDTDPVTSVGGLIGNELIIHAIGLPWVAPTNRHCGLVASFADGHARYISLSGKYKYAATDKTDPISQSFSLAMKQSYLTK